MKSQWNFYFESKGFRFQQVHGFIATFGKEQAEQLGYPAEGFDVLITVEPDAEPRFSWAQQTGTLRIVIPGDQNQTTDLAYYLADHVSEYISFTNGELRLLGGLVSGEYLAETPEEKVQLGENRYFYIMHVTEWKPPETFQVSALEKIPLGPSNIPVMRQYNAAVRANNPIDQFLGLFKIIEDFYGTSKKSIAVTLKASTELFAIACRELTYNQGDQERTPTQSDYDWLIDALVNTRHNCAHLRRSDDFGISHGDAKVKTEVEPLIEPLKGLVIGAINLKMKEQNQTEEK